MTGQGAKVDTTEWRVVPREVGERWWAVFQLAFREHRGIRLDVACPHCGTAALHQFYIRHRMADPAALAKRPLWMQERAARLIDAADGVEWCAHCRIYNHVVDKSAPPWWPDAVAEIERGYNGRVEHVFDVVAAYLAEHGDVRSV
jgi:hypothetical protein